MDSSSFAELADRLASTAKRWGINPIEVFEEYDRGKTGYLSPIIFSKALVSTNFYCSVKDNQALQNKYKESGLVNYKRFLQDVFHPATELTEKKNTIDQESLVKFGLQLQTKNLTVFDVILEFDRLRIGRVSIDTFYRAFGSVPLVKQIAEYYVDKNNGEVDYIEMNKDIQNALLHRSVETKAPNGPLPLFFENFVRCISSRNINLYDAFLEFDKYKRGIVTVQNFLSTVSSFGMPLSPSQLQEIAHPFTENDFINYKAFGVYVEKMAKSLNTQPQTVDVQASDLDSLLDYIKNRVEERRINLRDQLQTAESEARGRLSRQKFFKLMSYSGFNFSQGEIKAIDETYLRRDDTIDVGTFIQKINNLEQIKSPVKVDDIIRRLRNTLQKRQDSLVKYCAIFDRERSGILSLPQLISVFNSVDFHPTTYELNAIANQFGNGRFINWENICESVDPKIEKPTFTSTTIRSASMTSNKLEPPNDAVISILKRLHQASKRYNSNIRDDLVRLDIRKCGYLNSRTFREELDSLPTKISSAEILTTLKCYFKPNTDQICYVEFCDDLEKYGISEENEGDQTKNGNLMNILKETDLNEASQINQILRILKAALNCRRLTSEQMFIDRDSNKSGLILNELIGPSFAPISPFLNHSQISLLAKEFQDRRQPEKFNYRRMCAALCDVEPTNEDAMFVADVRKQISGENDGIQFLTNELKTKLAERKKTPYDLFVNVNAESVSATQFRNRIEQTGIIVSENDMQKLLRKYKFVGSNEVNWIAFCNDVNESQPMQY